MSWVFRYKYVVCCLLVTALGLSFITGRAFAANEIIAASPTRFDLVLSQGETYSGSLNIVNQGEVDYNFITYAEPYSVTNEQYSPLFKPIPGKPNPASWFKLSTPQLNLKAGQSAVVNFTITVPTNTLSGGYYAVIFGETQNPKSSKPGLTIDEQVGTLFFMQVGTNVVKKGNFVSWGTKGFFESPPLVSNIKISDTGNIHFTASYHYVVSDIFGSPKFTLNTEKTLLPQTIRDVEASWAHTPSFGLYKVGGNVEFLGQTHQLGTKYVLVMSSTVRKIFIIIIICLILVIFSYLAGKRHKKKNKKKQ